MLALAQPFKPKIKKDEWWRDMSEMPRTVRHRARASDAATSEYGRFSKWRAVWEWVPIKTGSVRETRLFPEFG
jgi:hypothetical protein